MSTQRFAQAGQGTPTSGSPPPARLAELRTRVHAAVANALDRPVSSLEDGQSFVADLEVDSIAVIDILCALEDELGIEIDELDIFPVETLGQLVELLATHQPVPGPREISRPGGPVAQAHSNVSQ